MKQCMFCTRLPDDVFPPLVAYFLRAGNLSENSLQRASENGMDFWSDTITPDSKDGGLQECAILLFHHLMDRYFWRMRDALFVQINGTGDDLLTLDIMMRFIIEFIVVWDIRTWHRGQFRDRDDIGVGVGVGVGVNEESKRA
jgi:hypothetical protein